MAMPSSHFREDLSAVENRLAGEGRQYRRVHLELHGRFMRADRNEYECTLKAISVGGATLSTPVKVTIGEKIVAYFDNLGGFEGTVLRVIKDGFAVQFKVSEYKREKLAAQIMWLLNRGDFPDDLGRRHERVKVTGKHATMTVEDGVVIDVELLDLSASGASCSTPARPPLGSFVLVNKTRAIVRRHHETGIGLQFLTVHSAEMLRQSFP